MRAVTIILLSTAAALLRPETVAAQITQEETTEAFGDIIVTGQKRDTTLQESDISVTVLDEETIRETRLRDVRRIDDLVPNVQFNESGQLSSVFVSIRGVESNPFIVNRAAIYIDGIPFRELNNAVLGQTSSVEVLRGPQATLYGANSEAGLILINSRQPTNEFEGNSRLTAGFYGGGQSVELDGFLAGPINSNLNASLAFLPRGKIVLFPIHCPQLARKAIYARHSFWGGSNGHQAKR